jgi:hypothetical protein
MEPDAVNHHRRPAHVAERPHQGLFELRLRARHEAPAHRTAADTELAQVGDDRLEAAGVPARADTDEHLLDGAVGERVFALKLRVALEGDLFVTPANAGPGQPHPSAAENGLAPCGAPPGWPALPPARNAARTAVRPPS